ncbi:hypothetical protein H0H92_007864 [Tricholoma furcatifolium]|nr:hypothetical protein H0H92_007864 [Tricholoma furcatifolium]
MLAQAHHPPPSTQKKVPRPRPIARGGGAPANKGPSSDVPVAVNELDPELHDLNQSTDDFDSEMRLTNSDDEPDSSVATALPKSSTEGVSVRALVTETRHAGSNANVASQDGGHKRKASAASTDFAIVTAPSKKMKKNKGGLRNDWNRPTAASAPVLEDKSQDKRTKLSRSLKSQGSSSSSQSSKTIEEYFNTDVSTPRAQADQHRDPEDSDNESVGGISDDASGGLAERAQIVENSKAVVVGSKVKSLARVVETRSVPEFVPGISSKILKSRHLGANMFGKKKAEIRITDLNNSVRSIWDSTFKPRVIEYLGTLTPWQAFSDDDVAAIQDLWAEVYPYEPRLESDAKLNYFVNKLLDDIITTWQHKFSSTANHYLTSNIFEAPELSTPEARANWAQWALGRDVTDEELVHAPEYSRRFYYREYEEPQEPGDAATFKGIFQSPIVIATLSSHFQWLEKIDIADQGDEVPVGALVLTIQACRHHISQWTTGHCIKPPGPLANFSAANWGDRQDRDGPSGFKTINLTSDIVEAVQELTDSKWKRIKKAVTEYLTRQHKPTKRPPALIPPSAQSTGAPTKPRFRLRDQDDTEDSEPEDETSDDFDSSGTAERRHRNLNEHSDDHDDEDSLQGHGGPPPSESLAGDRIWHAQPDGSSSHGANFDDSDASGEPPQDG